MTVFVDTSALLAYVDRDQEDHADAVQRLQAAALARTKLVTTSYALLETYALVQRRLGMDWTRRIAAELEPLLTVEWVSADLHHAAVAALLTAGRRNLSLVDCTSFELMRRLGLSHAIAYDEHFEERGYELPPFPEAERQ
jgi:uncharacterized protein